MSARERIIEAVWTASQLHVPQLMLDTADVQALLSDLFAAERPSSLRELGRQAAREHE